MHVSVQFNHNSNVSDELLFWRKMDMKVDDLEADVEI